VLVGDPDAGEAAVALSSTGAVEGEESGPTRPMLTVVSPSAAVASLSGPASRS
jgi:hypothetical protein